MTLALKAYCMAYGHCPGVVNNDMTVEDFCKKVGGTAGTSGTGGRSAVISDGGAGVNDLHNTNGTAKANATAIQAYFPTRIVLFPRANYASWNAGSGWWNGYNSDTALQDFTNVDFTKLDQIAKAAPDGTWFLLDVEYATGCPMPTATEGSADISLLNWQQNETNEARAISQIGTIGSALMYFKAVCSALGKPNIKVISYNANPLVAIVFAAHRYNRDVLGKADTPAGALYPLGGYAALCDRLEASAAWGIRNGAFSKQMGLDGVAVDSYLPYSDATAAARFGAAWDARAALGVSNGNGIKLAARLNIPTYAIIMGERPSGGPMDVGPRLVTTAQFQAMIDQAACGHEGVIWYTQTFYKTAADVNNSIQTYPAFDAAIEPFGPANFFTTAQSVATR